VTRRGLARAATIALPVLLLGAILAAWIAYRGPKLALTVAALAGPFGDLLALAGLVGLAMMVVLGTRAPWVEHHFGLDRLYRFHQRLGPLVLALFAGHALLRTLHHSLKQGGGWSWSFLFYLGTRDPALLLGHLAIGALLVAAILALLGHHRVPFRTWKSAHLLVYPGVILGFVHAWIKGSGEFVEAPNLAVFVVLAIALLGVFCYRLAYMLGRDHRHTWQVSRVVPETHDVTSLVLERPAGPGTFAGRRAGQFAVIRVWREGRWSEPHPFTISAPPSEPELRFTIKAAGRFTSAVPSLAAGTPVLCEGPYGVFTADLSRERELVMISGGVGITPFLSLIRHAAQAAPGIRITLICANRTADDIIARDELSAASQRVPLRVVHVLSQAPPDSLPPDDAGVSFERGHVGAELLARHVPPGRPAFYLCGPPSMQEAVLRALRESHGVPRRRVRRELFFY
jgi:predicted ferric reductase